MIGRRHIQITLALCAAAPLGAQRTPRPVDAAHGRIVFSVVESYADAAGRTRMLLQASTERPYGCGLPLVARLTRAGDAVVLDQWAIGPVVVCPTVVTPASGEFVLPWDAGTHELVIRRLGADDRYRVAISSEAIRVAPDGAWRGASILRDTVVWRFPRYSFGVQCGAPALNGWVCAEIHRMVARTPGLEPVDLSLDGRDPDGSRFTASSPWHDAGTRYYRTTAPRDTARLEREVQALYDAYVGRRLGYTITIFYPTGHRWLSTAPRDGDIR